MQKLHILAIAAHPDDIELGCAGTLIKHTRMGHAVGILDLTEGELGTRGSVTTRYEEAAAAAQVMGIKVRHNAQLADGFFRNDEDHQRRIIPFIRHYRPDIIIANALEDRHPDHGRGGRLIADACFLAGLKKVRTEWEGAEQEAWRPKRVFHMIQDRLLEPTFIVDISETFEQKMDAIKAYKTQFHNPGSGEPITYIATQDFIKQLEYRDAIQGKRIGVKYGEGFISENIPGVADLDKLILPEIS
ncbi:bacillithiol biosynthesis deacetylase BshB1 [Chitinophagaceae bacterium MMS25-I14]